MNVPARMTTASSTRLASVRNKERDRLRAHVSLAVFDIVALAAAFLITNLIYWQDLGSQHGLAIFGALCPLYLGFAGLVKVYSATALRSRVFMLVGAVQSLLYAGATVLLIAYLFKAGSEFSRAVFAIGIVVTAVLLLGGRFLLFFPILRSLGGTPYMTVLIRDGVPCAPRDDVVLLTPDELGFDPDTSDPFQYHALALAVAQADRLLVACPVERRPAWVQVLKCLNIDGEIVDDETTRLGAIGLGRHGDLRTLIITTGPLGLRSRLIKRGFDLVVAGVGTLVLAPLLLVVAIAIRLESKGSAFFRQDRIGRDNEVFRMYKFRSMRAEQADAAGARSARRGDDRVTRIGRFIRKTSIDELPQLLNVLKGDMSIVGPRPHPIGATAADLLFWDVDSRYRHRHTVKPGLTGLAQVRGFRGATHHREDLVNRLAADLEYVANWSLLTDIRIILATLTVLRHPNAY